MLTKILFTIVVIVGVAFFFRNKSANRPAPDAAKTEEQTEGGSRSLSTKTLAYLMIAILIAVSILIFVISYNSNNRIVNIRVISESGTSMSYQARHKTIKGRQFETLDGKLVTLGESDRIEMIEQ